MSRVIERAELDAAERERARLIKRSMGYQLKYQPRYETWCYCSWCPWSGLSTPHYRRQDCPHPSMYAAGRGAVA